jgi:hypothetical protein
MSPLRALLAAFALRVVFGAITSASASASCLASEWCVAGSTLGAGETAELNETPTVVANFVLESPSPGVKIECTTLTDKKAFLDGTNAATAESLTFGNCKTVGAPKCELEGTTITTKPLKVGSVTAVGTEEVTAIFEPQTGTGFAAVKLKGATCSITGTQAITGTAPITMPKGQIAAT